jgi:hypothetical protein
VPSGNFRLHQTQWDTGFHIGVILAVFGVVVKGKGGSGHEAAVKAEQLPEAGADVAVQTGFWATHNGAELDLLMVKGSKRYGFEIKLNSAPTLTPSMKISLTDLQLDVLVVVHPGSRRWPMADRIVAWGLEALPGTLGSFGE